MGPDDLLIRINEDSVLTWLSSKVERAAARFTDLATKDVAQGESGWAAGGAAGGEGYAGDFQTIAAPMDARRRKEVEAECKQRALEAVCEYLGDDWATKLAEKFRWTLLCRREGRAVVLCLCFGGRSLGSECSRTSHE